jgi:hypothetical protein
VPRPERGACLACQTIRRSHREASSSAGDGAACPDSADGARVLASGLDELGNYAEVSADFSSSGWQKSRPVTPSSAKDHCPSVCSPYIPIPAEMTDSSLPLRTTNTSNAALPLVREAEVSAP